MDHLSTFLKKFQTLKPPERIVRDAFIKVVQREVGVTLTPKEISVKKGILFLNTHSIVKSEVILKKQTLLDALNNEEVNIKVNDIK